MTAPVRSASSRWPLTKAAVAEVGGGRVEVGDGEGQTEELGRPVAGPFVRPDQLEDDLAQAEERLCAASAGVSRPAAFDAGLFERLDGAVQVGRKGNHV